MKHVVAVFFSVIFANLVCTWLQDWTQEQIMDRTIYPIGALAVVAFSMWLERRANRRSA